MERVFTEDVGRNFKRGDIKDYPLPTWRDIETAAHKPLESFSKPLEDAVKHGVENILRRTK